MPRAIIVHGGAGERHSDEDCRLARIGTAAAAEAGWKVLDMGGSALDAVEAAVRALEDETVFNAGYGSALNAEGQPQMDAAVMNGEDMGVGSVACIEGVRHPISVARQLMTTGTVMLAGAGARRFAQERDIEPCDPAELISERARNRWLRNREAAQTMDTVGCVAVDAEGNLAAGTSTGGLAGKMPGRVGDSPIVGAGLYAENGVGACSLTGHGEEIIRTVLGWRIVALLASGLDGDEAIAEGLRYYAERTPGDAGVILADADGRIFWGHHSPYMACAYRTEEMAAARAYTSKGDEREETATG